MVWLLGALPTDTGRLELAVPYGLVSVTDTVPPLVPRLTVMLLLSALWAVIVAPAGNDHR